MRHASHFLLWILLLCSLAACARDPRTIAVRDWAVTTGSKGIVLQATCVITADPAVYRGVTTGRTSAGVGLSINGVDLGHLTSGYACVMPLNRHYPIVNPVLVRGNNRITLRLDSPAGERAAMQGDLLLQPEGDFENARLLDSLITVILPMSVILFFILSSLSLLVFFILNRQEKFILCSFLVDLCVIGYLVSLYVPFRYLGPETVLSFQRSLIPVLCALAILMSQAMLHVYLGPVNWTALPLLAAAAIAAWGLQGPAAAIPGLISLAAATLFTPLFIRRFHHNRGDAVMVGIYAALIATSFVMLVAEIALRNMGSPAAHFIIIFASPVCVFLFHAILSRGYLVKTLEMEKLYAALKKKDTGEKGPTITETAEEKLKRVIDFINANYTSDLAREGLAAAVDLNPDYMSRIFRVYTGMKINEYITGLRVRDTALRLLETDDKIIDIALDAGFESLTTFNRSFRKVMGASPTDYRKNTPLNANA